MYIRGYVNDNLGLPDLEKLSIAPICNISDDIFTQEKNSNFNIKLFDYQKKSITRMIEIENNKNMEFNRTLNINIDIDNKKSNIFKLDPHTNIIVKEDNYTKVI